MRKHVISGRLIVLFMILCLAISSVSVYGASKKQKVTVKNVTAPTSIREGSSFKLKGTIKSSKKKIKRVEIGVTTAGGGKWTAQKYDKKRLSCKSFNIKKADKKIKFGKLAPGSYVYRVYVHTADKKVHCVVNQNFTVVPKSGVVTASTSACTFPTQLNQGQGFGLRGTVSASANIDRVDVGVVNASGGWTLQKYSAGVGSPTFNVAKADSTVRFGSLPIGTYYYRINVAAGGKELTVLNQPFTIVSNTAPSTGVPGGSTGASKVTLSGVSAPGNYSVGKNFQTRGTVSCEDTINKVEVGIIVAATNKWSQYKYEANVGSNSFDLSRAASSLRFDMLPGGDFRYRMYAHTSKGVVIVFDKKFTVTPSAVPRAAINWASAVAADNMYTYGKGYSGYFTCPVCAGKYSKKDSQYTCMPFLAAAYAHASGRSDLMGGGRHVMNLNDDNFKGTLGNNWFKVGLCRDLTINDLQPGDVIIKWSASNDSGHSWMYGGGDSIIEAVPADIRVLSTGAATKLKRYGSSEGTPSKNYVMRFRH